MIQKKVTINIIRISNINSPVREKNNLVAVISNAMKLNYFSAITGPSPQEAYLTVGATDFTTSCTAYGPSDVDITWTFSGDDGTLPTGASSQSYSYNQTDNSIRSTLTIATIAAIHVGTYTCTSTADTSLTETFALHVYGEF